MYVDTVYCIAVQDASQHNSKSYFLSYQETGYESFFKVICSTQDGCFSLLEPCFFLFTNASVAFLSVVTK